MDILFNKIFFDHKTDGMHPESCKRLEAFPDLQETEIRSGESFLGLVHTPDHIQKVINAGIISGHLDGDTMTSPGSFKAAVHAVGATIMAAEQNDFALVRPPGHHAYAHKASGFCLFNNIAIATQHLVNQKKRVLIVDFDGHLGDGTSHIFKKSDDVLYWSIHQFPAFPYQGTVNEIGEGKGKGFTINMPIPAKSGDDIFMDAFEQFLPIVSQFQPDVVAVSAGFDAHLYDLLLDLRVTVNSFYQIGRLLGSRFKQLFATLEGGYNVSILPHCVDNFIAGVNGEPMPHSEEKTTSGMRAWETYDLNKHILFTNLKDYWKV